MSIEANLKRMIEAEAQHIGRGKALRVAMRKVKTLLESGKVSPSEFNLKRLALALCGPKWFDTLNPMQESVLARQNRAALQEADATVDNTAFSNITGQIIYAKILEGYKHEEFIGGNLVTIENTNLETEKIAGMGGISDEAMRVEEGMPIPYVGHGESFQITPLTYKRALGIAVTKEAIFFDRTGQVLKNAKKLGERVAILREKEILDMVIGVLNNYNWRNLALSTYQAAPLTAGLWVNSFTGNELLSWNSIDTAMQQFQDVRDPETGDPILVGGMQLLVPPAKRMTAARIQSATEVREVTGNTETLSGNPVAGKVTGVLSSQLLRDRMVAAGLATPDKRWFMGNFKRAFEWRQNWGLTVVQAPTNGPDDFDKDIIVKFKASERGVAAVSDPRFVQQNNI